MAKFAVVSAAATVSQQVCAVVQQIFDIADRVKLNKEDSISLALYVSALNLPLQRE
jgi:hypothetical protein